MSFSPGILKRDPPPGNPRRYVGSSAGRPAHRQRTERDSGGREDEIGVETSLRNSHRRRNPAPVGPSWAVKKARACLAFWNWWRGGGSNSRPSHCERDALPAELPPQTAAHYSSRHSPDALVAIGMRDGEPAPRVTAADKMPSLSGAGAAVTTSDDAGLSPLGAGRISPTVSNVPRR